MKRFAYTRADGGVSVVIPVEGCRLCSGYRKDGKDVMLEEPLRLDQIRKDHGNVEPIFAESEADWLAFVKSRSNIPADAVVVECEHTDLPSDRTFRNAWSVQQQKVGVDLPKARDIVRNRIRAQRVDIFPRLDVAYQRADEKTDALGKQAVAQKKQMLRDAPADPRIASASTPDQLKAALAAISQEMSAV